jgi:hypothetical protein
LLGFPSSEILSIQDIHPEAVGMKMLQKSKNVFMKTGTSLFMTSFMRLESHLDPTIAF